MKNIWRSSTDERIVTACQLAGKLYVFTDKSVYEMEPPPKIPWYKRLWKRIWLGPIGGK